MNTRKRKIIEASLQLFIEKGFHHTSVQDIIEHSNISKGTFYNYFASKNECFLAILEQLRYTAQLQRYELLTNRDEQDIHVLIEQIIIPMKLHEEQNLMTLFEGIFQSSDLELKKGLRQHRFHEIKWLTERFINVFGEEIRPYAFECALIFFGITHYLGMAWRGAYHVPADLHQLVQKGLEYVEALLPTMQQNNDVLITIDALQRIQKKSEQPVITKECVIEQLTGFVKQLETKTNASGHELVTFLIEELTQPSWRKHVIKATLQSFRTAFKNTTHEAEAIELSYKIAFLLK
ncbi:TetR/AcrR family transcriptional regulator [Metasolibacillus meyeri]|uniref:TetR/AcrR family transcriptional regulator n=1 Tax=Metasolibacillus meyeri TaxID=1071052 RepID=UPI000D318AB3|nr:TetR/AcrR family transcriptional regulator [Metasolibacillus meyeri]